MWQILFLNVSTFCVIIIELHSSPMLFNWMPIVSTLCNTGKLGCKKQILRCTVKLSTREETRKVYKLTINLQKRWHRYLPLVDVYEKWKENLTESSKPEVTQKPEIEALIGSWKKAVRQPRQQWIHLKKEQTQSKPTNIPNLERKLIESQFTHTHTNS